MRKVRFEWLFAIIILFSSLFAGASELRPLLSKPETRDRNQCELQKIDSTQKEFSFAVFGDNRDSEETFKNLLDSLNMEHPLFAVAGGDIVSSGEKKRFDLFLKQIGASQVPLLTVIGNHEVTANGRSNYYEIFGSFYYSFTVGNSYFIVLDDSDPRKFDTAQMIWLEDELKKSQSYKNRFVFMHIPLYDPRKGDREFGHSLKNADLAERLNRLFDENNVTMLFASHIHGYYRGMWGRTPFIITGGAGAELTGSSEDHDFYHYIRVRVLDEGIKYEIVRVESPIFFPLTIFNRS